MALIAGAPCASAASSVQDPQEPSLAELRRQLEELREKHGEELEDLRFQVETLEKQLAEAQARSQAPSAQRANVFNPAITVFGNFLARSDDQPVFLDGDPTLERIDDRFNLREVELDARAAIDPWADGVLIATFESEVPNEFSVEIEEGYATLKKLPLLDVAPGGLKLKAGRFRGEFGRFNYIHLHDLPQTSYPRALRTFLGEEGYIQNGISGQFFLPPPSPRQTLEATVQLLDGGDVPVDATGSGSDLALLGHLKWFREIGEDRSLELGLSSWSSNSDHTLHGLDATYKWKPYIGGEWRSFLLGGELYAARLDDPAYDDAPMGWYVWSQYQFDRNLYLGVRFDQAEELADASLVTDTFGAFLTYYTTEFLRLRVGAEHAESDLAHEDGRNSAFLELNFVFGSHPVEPYWVNR